MKRLSELTNEEKRIIVAEWEGWNRGTVTSWQSAFFGVAHNTEAWFHKDYRDWEDLLPPDYLNDLNAIVKACERLEEVGKCAYAENLLLVLNIRNDQSPEPLEMFEYLNAKAEPRVNALILTIGKAGI